MDFSPLGKQFQPVIPNIGNGELFGVVQVRRVRENTWKLEKDGSNRIRPRIHPHQRSMERIRDLGRSSGSSRVFRTWMGIRGSLSSMSMRTSSLGVRLTSSATRAGRHRHAGIREFPEKSQKHWDRPPGVILASPRLHLQHPNLIQTLPTTQSSFPRSQTHPRHFPLSKVHLHDPKLIPDIFHYPKLISMIPTSPRPFPLSKVVIHDLNPIQALLTIQS